MIAHDKKNETILNIVEFREITLKIHYIDLHDIVVLSQDPGENSEKEKIWGLGKKYTFDPRKK